MVKENQKLGLDEWDFLQVVYDSLLERGFSPKEIETGIKNIILKKDGGLSEEKALVLLNYELSGIDTGDVLEYKGKIDDADTEEVEDHEEEEEEDIDYNKELDLEDWIEIGDAFYEEGLFHEAAKFYDRAIEKDPELIQVWKKLGNTFLKLGEYDDANICFNIARRPVIDVRDIYVQIQEEDESRGEEDLLCEEELQDDEDEDEEEMELSIVDIPSDTWDYLVDGSDDSLWDFPVTLSCNSQKEVWFCVKYGHHRISERCYIDLGTYPSVEDAVDLVLNFNPRGARFHLNRERAYLTRSYKYKKICEIVVD